MKAWMFILCAALALPALSQTYPSRTVRVIVPHPAGGPGDVPPRGMAQMLTQTMGQPFVIENREGADGLIGAEAAAKAAPDGHTLISTSGGTMVVNPSLRKDASYSLASFTPIIHTGTLQQLILATPSVPANTMKELFDLARKKPESVTVGTFGAINLASIFVEWAKADIGVRFYPIPYKSASQGLQAALAGDVQVVSFAMGPALKHIQAGKLKALALSPRANPAVLPGVPGLREAGANFDFTTWWGWFGPAGIPREAVRRVNTEIAKLFADSAFHAKFIGSQGLMNDTATAGTPEAFEAYVKNELEGFTRLMKVAGLKPQ